MKQVHLVLGVITIVLSGAAALWGGWCWWRIQSSRLFWRLLRASQVAIVLEAALGGVLLLFGHKSPGLHTLYGVLPLFVSFVAEQLRISTGADGARQAPASSPRRRSASCPRPSSARSWSRSSDASSA